MKCHSIIIVLLLAATGIIVGCSVPRDEMATEGPKIVPIFDRADWELDQSLAKLTWNGDQMKPILTVVLRTRNCKAKLEECRKFQSPNRDYGNDEFAVREAEVTPNEFKQLLKAVRPTIEPLVGNRLDPAHLSFVVLRQSGVEYEGFEVLLTQNVKSAFFNALIGALKRDNTEGRKLVRSQAINLQIRLDKE